MRETVRSDPGRMRLEIPRDRSALRGGPIGEVEHDLVQVAPAPGFGRIITFDDRMAGCVEMLAGVPVRRIVAAAHMSAAAAQPQMHPDRAGLQAFLAAARARR